MIYGSICSGIEAATLAWQPLGWKPAFFSEIEKFPSAMLAHHYGSNMPDEPRSQNGVPNYGDMTQFERWPDHDKTSDQPIDLLVGGTPCQSFSIAGLRKGLADPRGNLMLTFGAIAKRYQPKWIIWENVPGILSSNAGRDFGTFLRLLGECGYGFAYRVLDAQFARVDGYPRAVPQRRRRVFVVGYFGDWRRAAAVLFEPESLQWNSPPRRKEGQGFAADIAPKSTGDGGLGTDFDCDGALIAQPFAVANCLTQRMSKGFNTTLDEGQTPVIAFNARQDVEITGSRAGSLDAGLPQAQAILYGGPVGGNHCHVRRLTPTECERLQGFPDNFTQIPWRGKPIARCPDGPRYQALGNSMAVNVMRWIGRRIEMIEAMQNGDGA